MPLFKKDASTIYLCEGPWDAMALWQALGQCKKTENGLALTANQDRSLLADANVLGVPGCTTFSEAWIPLFKDKKVVLMYDNDHPRIHPKTGKEIPPAGWTGMKRVAGLLAGKVGEVEVLCWGEVDKGYSPSLPSGYDLRDALGESTSGTLPERLGAVLERLTVAPKGWLGAKSGSKPLDTPSKGVEMECLPCDNYKMLINSWRKALRWTDGLDRALSCMLASISSTQMVGDQLWLKVVGPAACLDGDTPIYDPVDKSTKTVSEREKEARKFWVYSIKEGKVGTYQALPPKKFSPSSMFKVTFSSGKVMEVTEGHQFWTGKSYVSLRTISDELTLSSSYPLLTILEHDLLIHEPDGHHLKRKVVDYQFLPKFDNVIKVEYVGEREYFDFHVPETNNYWACGVFNHNCGKSTLCEAVSTNTQYVLAKSTIRGFHSGFKEQGGSKDDDNSLVSILHGKTLVTKDGDTLLQSPNLPQILSEGRDVYDGVSRTHYRNAMSKDYDGLRLTWILCGTSSLRQIDSSELGERFLDCVIMDSIDDDLEDEILARVVHRAARDVAIESESGSTGQYSPEMAEVMQLTGGYINWIRENASAKLSTIEYSPKVKRYITRLGKFVAHMRARPSLKQEEIAEREFATRLVSQLTRLAGCLALVLNRESVDSEVMRRVHQVAMDTSRGRTMAIADLLYDAGEVGMEPKTMAMLIGQTEDKLRALLRFLRSIYVAEPYQPINESGNKGRVHWKLTTRMTKLYKEVNNV